MSVQNKSLRSEPKPESIISPSVLFTMYGDIMDTSKRVQFIFPNKINLYSPEYNGPHFHTFVNEVEGFMSFYHVLTFYEELNFLQAESDFDCNTAIFAAEFEQAQRIEAELKS